MNLEIELFDDYEIECLGEQEHWVYDIEIEDNHNFFGNNILVHNSAYFELEPIVIKKFGPNPDKQEALKYIRSIADGPLQKAITQSMINFARMINAYDQTVFGIKRENISDVTIYGAKKRYVMNVLDSEGIEKEKLKITGLQSIKSQFPKFARKKMEDLYKILLFGTRDKFNEEMYQFSRTFYSMKPEEIYTNEKVNAYSDYYVNGRILPKCPKPVKAAVNYNILLQKYQLEGKYPSIRSGDKIKQLLLKRNNPTGFEAVAFVTEFPKEFNLDEWIDYEGQFDKIMIASMTSIAETVGWSASAYGVSSDII